MAYFSGYCPVDSGDELPFVVVLSGKGPVLLYCRACQCVWPSRADLDGDANGTLRGLSDSGLSEKTIRYATAREVAVAGHSSDREVPGWHPPGPAQGDLVATREPAAPSPRPRAPATVAGSVAS